MCSFAWDNVIQKLDTTYCLNQHHHHYMYSSVVQFSSVQFSHSVVSNSLRAHEPQHTRPPSLSLTPWVYPNSCPLSRWCRPTISSSVVPFSSCPQSFPASGPFQTSQLFTSGVYSDSQLVRHRTIIIINIVAIALISDWSISNDLQYLSQT